MSQRKLTVRIDEMTVHKSWGDSRLIVNEFDAEKGVVGKQVAIRIADPYDLRHIREQLAEIEKYWRLAVGRDE
jgi:hypothetical protein